MYVYMHMMFTWIYPSSLWTAPGETKGDTKGSSFYPEPKGESKGHSFYDNKSDSKGRSFYGWGGEVGREGTPGVSGAAVRERATVTDGVHRNPFVLAPFGRGLLAH